MSRIDDALKRVSSGPFPGGVRVRSAPPPAAVGDESSLDRYPHEGSALPRAAVEDTRLPVAPRLGKPRQLGPFDPGVASKLVATAGINAMSLEEYRRLAAALHKMQAEHGLKSLIVTSALPREGKTLTVTNLALTLSESYGRRVLLIDGDLRHPSIHEILCLPNAVGLSDGLRADGIQVPVNELSPTLSVLTAGQAGTNAVEGLASDRMKALIDEGAGRFDWVLVDTPPIGLLSDAKFMASLVDGVLLVIGARQTPYALVQRAVSELGPDHVVGTVLNRVEEQTIAANGYYSHYYGASRHDHG